MSHLVQSFFAHIFGRGFCFKFAQHLKTYFAAMTKLDLSKQALLWRHLHPMKSLGLRLYLLRIKSLGFISQERRLCNQLTWQLIVVLYSADIHLK